MIRWIRTEPAVIVSVIIALLGFAVDLTTEQKTAIEQIVQAVVILAGGVIIRQNVTPVVKLQ